MSTNVKSPGHVNYNFQRKLFFENWGNDIKNISDITTYLLHLLVIASTAVAVSPTTFAKFKTSKLLFILIALKRRDNDIFEIGIKIAHKHVGMLCKSVHT